MCVEDWRRMIRVIWKASKLYITRELSKAKHKHKPEGEQKAIAFALDQKLAQWILKEILELRGYYVKLAQTIVGSGQLPVAYEEAFSVLLEDCPSIPFEQVQRIVETELGCRLSDAFKRFDALPMAAASIGQVHHAVLFDGTPVVVKIQFPDAERFFSMDLAVMRALASAMVTNKRAKQTLMKAFDDLRPAIEREFDYTTEASNLRSCARKMYPFFGHQVKIPLPIERNHPGARGRQLCTRKVLTMEELVGESVKKRMDRLALEYASSRGMTMAELRELVAEQAKDPEVIEKYLQQKPVSTTAATAFIGVAYLFGGMHNAKVRVQNTALVPCGLEKRAYMDVSSLFNGPKMLKLLVDVHAHQIFFDGVYNTDPHAGNVLIMNDGRLGLVDYGAVGYVSVDQRTALAKLCIAIDNQDDDATVEWFVTFGFRSEQMDRTYILAYAILLLGNGASDMEAMYRVGVPRYVTLDLLETWLYDRDNLTLIPESFFEIQRLAMVLQGVGLEVGAGKISIATKFKPHALRFLEGGSGGGGGSQKAAEEAAAERAVAEKAEAGRGAGSSGNGHGMEAPTKRRLSEKEAALRSTPYSTPYNVGRMVSGVSVLAQAAGFCSAPRRPIEYTSSDAPADGLEVRPQERSWFYSPLSRTVFDDHEDDERAKGQREPRVGIPHRSEA